MESLIMFFIPTVVQVLLWLVMLKKKMITLVFSMVLGIIPIVVFGNWWYGNILRDPCAGDPNCMNETGMIFVLSLIGIIGSIAVSVVLIIVEVAIVQNMKKKDLKVKG